MQFKCSCGHRITDNTDNLNYKGYLSPDTSQEKMFEILNDKTKNLIESVEAGETTEQLNERYWNYSNPSLRGRVQTFIDSISKIWDDQVLVYECESCGRLAIDMRGHGGDGLLFFKPESPEKRIFPNNDGK